MEAQRFSAGLFSEDETKLSRCPNIRATNNPESFQGYVTACNQRECKCSIADFRLRDRSDFRSKIFINGSHIAGAERTRQLDVFQNGVDVSQELVRPVRFADESG